MHYLAYFFTGAFLCNAIPHLACGLQGLSFPTPFAKPRGVGDSSPLINTLWGLFNGLAGLLLLGNFPFSLTLDTPFGTAFLGALLIGTHMSHHFQQVQAGKAGKQ
jgi:hypothetical protein